jgi:hypothetical protein
MALSSESALVPETSTPLSDVPRGITHRPRIDGPQNSDEEDEDDPVLKTPETTSDDKWSSSLQVDPQSMVKSETFQVASISMAACT